MTSLQRAEVSRENRGLDVPPECVTFLGVRIHRLHLQSLLNVVCSRALHRRDTTVMYVNVHCLNVSDRDEDYTRFLNEADIVYCDGTGVRLGAALAGLNIPERMTGADWIDPLCEAARRDELSLFLLGGSPGSASDAATVLESRHPGLRIVGSAPGYGAGPLTLRMINRARPDILLVGMGTPTQEKWIAQHRGALDVPVVWATGALFDFVSGRIRRGPHWMTDHGLEWVCRLAAEPRKLWRRYLLGNPQFLWRTLRTYRLPHRAGVLHRAER